MAHYAFWLSLAERDRGHRDFAIGASAARRTRRMAWLGATVVAVIVFLMVVKPTF